ncbi:MAG: radical SAM protein [Pseudomonadota bacterium]
MRVILIYPPPWKIPAQDDIPDDSGEGPPAGWDPAKGLDLDAMTIPYGLLSLAAQVRDAGHEVIVLNLYDYTWRDITEVIHKLPADVYGLSCFTSNRRGTISTARLIREFHPEAYIVLGGPHVTALPCEMLEHCPEANGIVIGEGEITFLELIDCIRNNRPDTDIPGMAWRTHGETRIGPERRRIDDLDSLVSPYEYYEGDILLTSRGCPGNCTFCGSPAIWGRKLRFNSADHVLRTMERLVMAHGQKILYIKDDTFTCDRKRVLRICEGIRERGLNILWSCDTRVDALDEEMLCAMRRAGCERISLGVESASPVILRNINKRTTPEKVLAATGMAKKFGFQVRYYMMAGNRGETAETLQSSLNFIAAARPNKFIYSFLSLYPGTREFEIAEKSGLMTREMFFESDVRCFGYFLTEEETPELQSLKDWIGAHCGVQDLWEYSVADRQEILKLLHDLPAAYMDLGGAYYRSGDLDQAEKNIVQAVEMGYPAPGLGYNYLACIEALRGNLKATVNNLEKAQNAGIHRIVQANLRVLREWLSSGGLDGKKPLSLCANHDLEDSRLAQQPVMPGPIRI